MLTIGRDTSALLLIDFQSRLMPAIEGGAAAVANAGRLLNAARMLEIPVLVTEQNAKGLGPTVPELLPTTDDSVFHKMSFDACRMPGFLDLLPERRHLVIAGCETHVCVMQTALGLIAGGRRIWLVRDAVGSRRAESKETAIRRLERHGAEIVTTEMVIFEWLGTAEHPRFRDALALVR
ncbi:MAG TPA: isochorismatase family protein [Stellaceae bacterium]|jgi:nicotinamidase-related amidase|nr:isochorismatase family protein [Stellaceae bacterium]